jgi:ketosteroid isomerase-like protein
MAEEREGAEPTSEESGCAVIARLCAAVNAHDLDALTACFAADFRNETPAHPSRAFVGAEQVRKNWSMIFGAIPDVSADLVRCVSDGDQVWSEWEHRGTRPDGSRHLLRGVVLFGVGAGLLTSARFYLEPVDESGDGVDDAVRRQVTAQAAS